MLAVLKRKAYEMKKLEKGDTSIFVQKAKDDIQFKFIESCIL